MRNQWIHCPLCGHRLFFIKVADRIDMEVKCTSCKSIVRVSDDRGNEVIRYDSRKKNANDQKTA